MAGESRSTVPAAPPHLKNYRLTLEYDGTAFLGFQVQARGRTIQGELERAIAGIAGQPVRVHAAGRTDAGVHAAGQVVSFRAALRLDPATLVRALNAALPAEIAVLDAAEAPAEFHARFSAVRRRYRYLIWAAPVRSPLRRRAWHVRWPLDLAAMAQAAALLVGEHDFAAFAGSDPALRSTVRRLERLDVRVVEETAGGRLIAVDAAANAFLPHMVRNLVGLLVAVGGGKLAPLAAARILAMRDRRQAPGTAPAHGLCLVGVDYAGPGGKTDTTTAIPEPAGAGDEADEPTGGLTSAVPNGPAGTGRTAGPGGCRR